MDLGISTLSDDQLLELLEQACTEFGMRTLGVYNLATAKVMDVGSKTKAVEKALQAGIRSLRNTEEVRIAEQIKCELKALFDAGELRVMNAHQEATLVAKTAKQVLDRLAEFEREYAARMQQGACLNFSVKGDGEIRCAIELPGVTPFNIRTQRQMSPAQIEELGRQLRQAIGVGI